MPVGGQEPIDLGSFAADPTQGPWTVVVDWGDGAGQTLTVDHPGGIGGVPHAYRASGTYTVVTTLTDRLRLSASARFSVHVTSGAAVTSDAAGDPPPGSLVSRDEQSLASQSADTQVLFHSVWGAQAEAEWVAEHNASISH